LPHFSLYLIKNPLHLSGTWHHRARENNDEGASSTISFFILISSYSRMLPPAFSRGHFFYNYQGAPYDKKYAEDHEGMKKGEGGTSIDISRYHVMGKPGHGAERRYENHGNSA